MPSSDRIMRYGVEAIADLGRRSFLAELLRLLRAELGDELVSLIVLGSVARAITGPESDADVIVVARSMPPGMTRRMSRLVYVLDRLDESEASRHLRKRGLNTWVQFHPLSLKEARTHRPIYLDVVEDGVVLYDRDPSMEPDASSFRTGLGTGISSPT